MRKGTIFIIIMLMVTYMVTFHNIDLLTNYAVINNEQNMVNENHADLLQIRDCNLLGCQNYRDIYMISITIQFISVMFLGIIGVKAVLDYRKD